MTPEGLQLDRLLAANREFYRAFTERDLPAMQNLWARQAPLACVHPGWAPLIDRDSVLKSWQQLLGSRHSPRIACRAARGLLYGSSGLVICREVMETAVLAASNLFVVEDGIWRMVHHQSGPLARLPADDGPPPAHLLS